MTAPSHSSELLRLVIVTYVAISVLTSYVEMQVQMTFLRILWLAATIVS